MRTGLRCVVWAILCILPSCGLGWAQQPSLANAQIQTRSAGSGLEAAVRSIVAGRTDPFWVGYQVPLVSGKHNMCCYSSSRPGSDCCVGCHLESGRSGGVAGQPGGPVRLEGPRMVMVLFRVEAGAIQKIRIFTDDCPLDAGGLPFIWLTEVRAQESVQMLSGFAVAGEDTRDGRRLGDSAVTGIAMHQDASADQALESFVAPSQPASLRERTVFWLGNARGRRGFEALRKVLRDDSSPRVREKAIFALTQSEEADALTLLIETARSDSSTHVRGQALFWLAQKAGRQAMAAITSAIAEDPETEVKKKAVFALSQLPKDEGIPKLIEVARTNRNPEVRKQAMFWLGQSKDPRALTFFEEVLKK